MTGKLLVLSPHISVHSSLFLSGTPRKRDITGCFFAETSVAPLNLRPNQQRQGPDNPKQPKKPFLFYIFLGRVCQVLLKPLPFPNPSLQSLIATFHLFLLLTRRRDPPKESRHCTREHRVHNNNPPPSIIIQKRDRQSYTLSYPSPVHIYQSAVPTTPPSLVPFTHSSNHSLPIHLFDILSTILCLSNRCPCSCWSCCIPPTSAQLH